MNFLKRRGRIDSRRLGWGMGERRMFGGYAEHMCLIELTLVDLSMFVQREHS
jgi:hypothetical protein